VFPVDLQSNLWISLNISLAATALVFAAGLPLAWALSRPGWRGQSLLDVAVNLPLALPPTVVGYYLLLLIGREGPIGKLTRALWGSTLVFTPAAAAVAAAIVSLPLFVQAARSALEEIAPEISEAAQIDGAGRWETFRHVLGPLAWPGIWGGVLLAYVRSLGEFGATLMVAGNIPGKTQTMSLALYTAVSGGDDARAKLLAATLAATAALSMWVGLRRRQSVRRRRVVSSRTSRLEWPGLLQERKRPVVASLPGL
jgi:molybdate transport system permease protein